MPVIIEKNLFLDIGPMVKSAVRGVLLEAANMVKADAQQRIETGPKSGRTYKRNPIKKAYKTAGKRASALTAMGLEGEANKKTGKTSFVVGFTLHRASAPGEAPATDEGALVASGNAELVDDLTAEVTFGTDYALPLEEGSPSGKLAARPFLRPALDAIEPQFAGMVEKSVDAQLGRLG